MLNDFGADEWREIAKSITKAEAKDDPLLLKIKEIGERNLAELQPTLANSLKHAKEIEKANQQYEKKYYDKGPKPITLSDLAGILKKAAKVKAVNISFGNAKVGLKPGTQKSVPIALNARGKQYVKIFKQANITFMPVRISLSYLKKGTDKLKTIKSEVQSVGLN